MLTQSPAMQSDEKTSKEENFKKILKDKNASKNWFNTPKGLTTYHMGFDDTIFLKLKECSCANEKFDRAQNSRRQTSEKKMLMHTLKNYNSLDIDFTLRYLSLGCGQLLQDFIILGKLITQQDFKNINITLIDTNDGTDFKESFEQFKELLSVLATTFDVNINVDFYRTVDLLKESPTFSMKNSFHLINGIDYDDLEDPRALHAIMDAHRLLDDKGLFYLSYKTIDLLLGKKNCLEIQHLVYDQSELGLLYIIQKARLHIQNYLAFHLQQKETISYAALSNGMFTGLLLEVVEILPLLQTNKLDLTLLNTREVPDYMLLDLTHFIGLFIENIELNISSVASIEQYLSHKGETDIATVLFDSPKLAETKSSVKIYDALRAKGGEQIFASTLHVVTSEQMVRPATYMWSQNKNDLDENRKSLQGSSSTDEKKNTKREELVAPPSETSDQKKNITSEPSLTIAPWQAMGQYFLMQKDSLCAAYAAFFAKIPHPTSDTEFAEPSKPKDDKEKITFIKFFKSPPADDTDDESAQQQKRRPCIIL
jgi:hypothetical protein